MKKLLLVFCALLMIASLGQQQSVQAATHKATFIVNTATIPDTIPVTGSFIRMRGSHNSWAGDSTGAMTHIGGDYWTKTLDVAEGTTVFYKYTIEYPAATGWEQNVATGSTNREFTMGTADTTLEVEFWNNGAGSNPQYWRPWAAHPDSMMAIYFRVNMGGPITSGSFGFNNNTDTVGVRGGGPAGSQLNWSPTFYLTKEHSASNGSGYTIPATWFWSGALLFPKSQMTPGATIGYKYLIGFDWGRDEYQGGHPNRSFTVPSVLKDTTLYFGYFNDEKPTGGINNDTAIVTFHVNMAKAIASGGFSLGDTLYARHGYFGTGSIPGRRLTLDNLIGTIFEGTDTVITSVGKNLDYQYYALKNGVEIRENYYNFYFSGDQASEAERRQYLVPNKLFTILDTAVSITQARRMPDFPNSRTLARNVLVTYEVNLKPVYYQVMAGDTLHDIQGSFNIYKDVRDSIATWGVWINGPAVGGWSNPGGTDWDFGLQSNLEKKMWDDGTHGDAVAGDTIWTIQVQTSPDSIGIGSKGQVGQVFKFGVRGGDNEGGKGGYGNNESANIVDAGSTYTIHSQFGEINPAFYNAWDFDTEKPATKSVGVSYPAGWNMVSSPVLVYDGSAASLFPTATGKPFAYTGKYVQQDPINNGPGFWVKFPAPATVTYVGEPRNIIVVNVTKGWNMIGSVGQAAPVTGIASEPPGLVTSRFFGYTGSYNQVTSLVPGFGYWVKVNASGQLILNSSHIAASALIKIVDRGEVPPPPPGDELSSVSNLPKEYALSQNYPNPFNPSTMIKYQLPQDSKVTIAVYNALGQVVSTLVNGVVAAGYQQVEFKANNLATGVYFYRFDASSVTDPSKSFSRVEKMMIMR